MSFKTEVTIGGFEHTHEVKLGARHPVAMQTMWKEPLTNAALCGDSGGQMLCRIKHLEALGCKLLRFAVPDMSAAEALGELSRRAAMPLTADIHFDYRLALRCLDFPIAKIRINPGNIGSRRRRAAVLERCADKNIPVRIGINAGSLPLDMRKQVQKGTLAVSRALVEAAERELAIFDEFQFDNVVVSMKASSVRETIEANELFASRYNIPLHIGVTEAGPLIAGVVRSTAALFGLLQKEIGATIRVSLSDSIENEIIAAKEILLAARRTSGVTLISCPRCGRCSFDTHAWTAKWQDLLYTLDASITVAVMGCAVNGPGEARNADIGITGAGNKIIIFKRGKIIRTVNEDDADAAFRAELTRL